MARFLDQSHSGGIAMAPMGSMATWRTFRSPIPYRKR